MNPENAIEVKDLTKIYKLYEKNSDRLREALHLTRRKRHTEHYALQNVDLEIRRGETVGIIGTNGSGKSTILKIITGVLSPSGGSVKVNGRISALLELGAGFNMEYTGLENIYLNGTMIGFSKKEIDAKLQAILDFADIGDFVHQPVKTYSSGMFVRLAFAVAINIEPEILIVDEALSVGDVFFQAKCYHKFEEFKEMGKTILFVSHDLSSISKYCDRVILLNKGKKLGEGNPKKMIDIYKQVLVGQYPETGEEENLLENPEIQAAAAAAAEDGSDTSEGPGKALEESEGKKAKRNHVFSEGGKNKDNNALAEGKKADGNKALSEEDKPNQNKVNGQVTNQEDNTDLLEYGSRKAMYTEYYITDDKGRKTNAVLKGAEFTIHLKAEFYQDVPAPIFAFTIKNSKGTEITGTNTMFEKAFLESCSKGESKEITFTQKMNLQGGEYLLSFGLTGYEKDTFTVYHRLYDSLSITVISDKNTVGYYDMDSVVSVK